MLPEPQVQGDCGREVAGCAGGVQAALMHRLPKIGIFRVVPSDFEGIFFSVGLINQRTTTVWGVPYQKTHPVLVLGREDACASLTAC